MMNKTPCLRWLPTLLLPLMAAACGGGGDSATAPEPEQQATASATRELVWPLIADDGSIMPSAPQLTPADPSARTRAARYASEQQAAQLEAALGQGAISTDVNAADAGTPSVDLAVTMALAQQAAHELKHDAPVLVRGNDGRLAAAAAERLADLGFATVFVVAR